MPIPDETRRALEEGRHAGFQRALVGARLVLGRGSGIKMLRSIDTGDPQGSSTGHASRLPQGLRMAKAPLVGSAKELGWGIADG